MGQPIHSRLDYLIPSFLDPAPMALMLTRRRDYFHLKGHGGKHDGDTKD
jgi:hypothetical protein